MNFSYVFGSKELRDETFRSLKPVINEIEALVAAPGRARVDIMAVNLRQRLIFPVVESGVYSSSSFASLKVPSSTRFMSRMQYPVRESNRRRGPLAFTNRCNACL